jgi:hypothetical protein
MCCSMNGLLAAGVLTTLHEDDLARLLLEEDMTADEAALFARELHAVVECHELALGTVAAMDLEAYERWPGGREAALAFMLGTIQQAAVWYEIVASLGTGVTHSS